MTQEAQAALEHYRKAIKFLCTYLADRNPDQVMLDNPSVLVEVGARAKRVIETRGLL